VTYNYLREVDATEPEPETTMKTTLKAIEYVQLLWLVGFWSLLFWLGCQVSRSCRKIRAELAVEGECIDPIKGAVVRLDELHAELFGSGE
jgi:hypothetical protein